MICSENKCFFLPLIDRNYSPDFHENIVPFLISSPTHRCQHINILAKSTHNLQSLQGQFRSNLLLQLIICFDFIGKNQEPLIANAAYAHKIYNHMSRRKQKTILNTSNQIKNGVQVKPQSISYIPQFPLTSSKYSNMNTPDSLQKFQWELEQSLIQKRILRQNQQQYQSVPTRNKKRRAQTEYQVEFQPEDEFSATKLNKLQKQIADLKGQISMNKSNGLESKLDRLLQQMIKNRQADRQFYKQQRNSSSIPQQQPNNIFYPPMPFYHPQNQYQQNPYEQQRDRQRYRQISDDKSELNYKPRQEIKPRSTFNKTYERDDSIDQKSEKKSTTIFAQPKKRPFSKKLSIRKYFYAVLFTKFLKKEAQTLVRARKMTFRSFFIEKFDSQIASLKEWLLQSQGYALPVVLEKEDISLQFWTQRSEQTEKQRQDLILNLMKLGLEKMRKDCASHKITAFSDLLQRLCMRGSFVMSRFWSAYEMENLCVSEFYGCIRADDSLEKSLIGMVVFIKMLIFNMILQPHKFDNQNFPKSNQKLTKNMYILGSAYYRLMKKVLRQYIMQKRPRYYKLGNWLNLKQEFLVQCCQPLRLNVKYPAQGEWISGLIGDQLEPLERRSTWGILKTKIKQILTCLHTEVKRRRKDNVRTQKHKLYN